MPAEAPFLAAGRHVAQRLALVRWCAWQQHAALGFCALAVIAGLGRLVGVPLGTPLLLAVVLWLVGSAAVAWLLTPPPPAALARWDAAARRADAFLSALCFEALPAPTPGQRLHLMRSRAALPTALPALARDLPLPVTPRAWLAPLLAL